MRKPHASVYAGSTGSGIAPHHILFSKGRVDMPAQQRQMAFLVASAVTILLVIIGILYLAGTVIATTAHDKRAVACFVLAVIAAIIAYVLRPQATIAR